MVMYFKASHSKELTNPFVSPELTILVVNVVEILETSEKRLPSTAFSRYVCMITSDNLFPWSSTTPSDVRGKCLNVPGFKGITKVMV